MFSHFFDVHATFSRGHDEDGLCVPVNEQSEVIFVCNIAACLNVEVVDDFSFIPGLNGDQKVAKDVCCIRVHFVLRESDFDAAFHDDILGFWIENSSLSTSTCMDLGLDSNDFATKGVVSVQCFINSGAVDTFEDGHTSGSKQHFSLIFVDVHCSLRVVHLMPVFEHFPSLASNHCGRLGLQHPQ